jgi:DNA-binding transcriptional ArsR family regulator
MIGKLEIHGIARDITENIILKKKLNKSKIKQKLLCHMIEGSRGGNTRAKILKCLFGKSYNAHQLTEILDMDYKTIRHHLDVLSENEMIIQEKYGHITLYAISKNIESDLIDIYLGTWNDKK